VLGEGLYSSPALFLRPSQAQFVGASLKTRPYKNREPPQPAPLPAIRGERISIADSNQKENQNENL
jgi:hypothetical protein